MTTLDKITALMKERGITQKQLTENIGLSKGNFSEWKAGRSESYLKYITQIARLLGVSADYLLDCEPMNEKVHNLSKRELKFGLFGDADFDDDAFDEIMRTAQAIKNLKEKRKQ